MKKIIALAISVISVFSVFAFSACGENDEVSESTLEEIRSSQSEKVSLISWAKAFASTDIYNSTAVCKGTTSSRIVSSDTTSVSNSVLTGTVYNELTYKNGKITGKEYVLADAYSYDYDVDEKSCYDYNVKSYFIIDDTSLTLYKEYGDEYYGVGIATDESGVTVSDTAMNGIYIQLEYSGGSLDGLDYSDFTYDTDRGSYICEYTSGYYTYEYEIKFSDGNIIYYKTSKFYYYYSSLSNYTNESSEIYEYFYIYGGVSVTIPNEVQERIDSLS